jgi:hypothetical protein
VKSDCSAGTRASKNSLLRTIVSNVSILIVAEISSSVLGDRLPYAGGDVETGNGRVQENGVGTRGWRGRGDAVAEGVEPRNGERDGEIRRRDPLAGSVDVSCEILHGRASDGRT